MLHLIDEFRLCFVLSWNQRMEWAERALLLCPLAGKVSKQREILSSESAS